MYKEPTQKRHKPSEQSLSGEIEIVAKALQARLEEHDKNRKTVQESYQKHFMKKTQRINDLKERLIKKLEDETTTKVDALQNILGKILQSKKGSDELGKLLQKAKEELSTKWSFSVKFYYRNINGQYEIVAEEEVIGVAKIESKEGAVDALNKRIDSYDKNRLDLQEEIHIIIERLRTEANQLREKFSMNLEEEFKKEDSRIQKALTKLRKSGGNYISKAKNALSIKQFYEFAYMEELKTKKEIACEWLDLSKVANLKLITIKDNRAYFTREVFSDLMQLLCQNGLENSISYKAFLQKESCRNDEGKEFDVTIPYLCLTFDYLEPEETYILKTKAIASGAESEWSEGTEFTTPQFSECCTWSECPGYVDRERKYSVDKKNPRIATKINDGYDYWSYCTVIGNTSLPQNKVTSWSIKILKSKDNNGSGIFIGVAPSDINQNEYNKYKNCGWYLHCYDSTLSSGPPHSYSKKYGPRKEKGQYIHTGDSVGVVMNTAKGELSFVVNGVNLGVAFDGIPLDKPLVPFVILCWSGDSVELDTSEVKETNVNRSIPVPSNITAKSIAWDSITLSWDVVEGASFYQIEVDGNKFWDASTTDSFTKTRLLPETEHSFRVRAVCENGVSEWSDAVKGRTQKPPEFSEFWKKCPDYVDEKRKYSVDEMNPRTATLTGGDWSWCTIIGNTPLPHNKMTSWSIKILKSMYSNGCGIYIGVAPSDIGQNEYCNYCNCGWYFNCYYSTLWSGPPHNYSYPGKEYGPRKGDGEYVHRGDSVGVVINTVKGELSFVLNGANLGVAYDGIPLDKPLVSCVLLYRDGDSVELIT